jgi:hypothetical protein
VVHTGSTTTVDTPGVTVSIPAGDEPAGTTATLHVTSAPPAGLPTHQRYLGPTATLSLHGALAHPATLTFHAPSALSAAKMPPVVEWDDGHGGLRWLPTTWTAGRSKVTATTDHFSSGFLSGIDITGWAGEWASDFSNYVTGRSGVAQPSCGDEKNARADGTRVASDGGDRTKWCFGSVNGQHLLKVANNTRTYQQISYPSSWQVVDGFSASISADAVARNLGAMVTTARGTASRIVHGGDVLTLAVPNGASGRVTAETSIVAWDVSAISFGAQVYAAVAKAAGSALGQAAKGAADRIAVLLGATDQADELDELKSCMNDARDLTELDGGSAKAILKLAFKCVPDLMASQVKDVSMFALGVILKMVATAGGLVLTAVNLIVTGLREIWDNFAAFGGHSDTTYDIVISGVAQPLKTVDVTTYGEHPVTYRMTLWASDRIHGCSTHASGQVAAYFRAHPCRSAERFTWTMPFHGRTVVLEDEAVDVQPGPFSSTSTAHLEYEWAIKLIQLENAPGTGSINDLISEGARVPGAGGSVPGNEAFKVCTEDNGVTVFDAWYLDGSTVSQDPHLLALEQSLFLTRAI